MADGQTYYLQEQTKLSILFEQFDANDDLTPTIECAGFNLILDEGCDAVDANRTTPSGRQAIYNITIRNSGPEIKLILEDRSRIRLAKALPSNVCPWINPDKPLPYYDETTGNYETNNTANARCEIQLNGNFGLGGGPANLSTMTRPKTILALVLGFPSNTEVCVDRDIDIHVGDYLAHQGIWTNGLLKVLAWDSTNRIATLSGAWVTRNIGSSVGVFGGGVLIYKLGTGATSIITSNIKFGTLNVVGNSVSDCAFNNCYASGIRLNWRGSFNNGTQSIGGLCTNNAVVEFSDEGFIWGLLGRNCPNAKITKINFGKTASWGIIDGDMGGYCQLEGKIKSFNLYISGQHLYNSQLEVEGDTTSPISESTIIDNTTFIKHKGIQYEKAGTVTQIEREDFPEECDIDLPNAFLHTPATDNSITWRYSDYFVRNNETIRLSIKMLLANKNSNVIILIADSNLWPILNHSNAFTKITNLSNNILKWQSNSISWTNNTGDDIQIRVWELVTGSTLGAYVKTWRSGGGSL